MLNRLGMSGTAIIETIKERKMQYYGDIKRHNNIFKELLYDKAEGKRERGRQQRTTWGEQCGYLGGDGHARVHVRWQPIGENGGVVCMLQSTSRDGTIG